MKFFVYILLVLSITTTVFPQSISWAPTNGPLHGSILTLTRDSNGVIYAGTENGGIIQSTDYGVNWISIGSNPPELNICAIACGNKDNTIIAGSSTGKIYLSGNSGSSWSLQANLSARITDIKILSTKRVIATTCGNLVHQSKDYGISWNRIPVNWSNPNCATYVIGLPDGNCIFTASDSYGCIYFSNFAQSVEIEQWTGYCLYSSSNSLVLDPFGYMFFGIRNTIMRALLIYPGIGRPEPGQSTTWQVLPQVDWTVITSDRNGRLFIGTSGLGIYNSVTHGESWEPCSTGLLSDTVLALLPLPDGYMLAGASDGKVYKSEQSTLALLPPLPISPPYESVNIIHQVAMKWRRSFGASRYRVQVSTDSEFASGIVFDSTVVNDTSAFVWGLAEIQNFFWRVRSENASEISSFSNAWKFTSGPPAPSPIPSFPVFGDTNIQVNGLKFLWNSVPKATEYSISVSRDSSGENGIWYITTLDTFAIFPSRSSGYSLFYNSSYYWRLWTRCIAGISEPSAPWKFTTSEPPPLYCYLSSPADNAREQPTSLTFQWTAGVGARWYHLQVATDQNFQTGMVYSDSMITTTSSIVSGLSNDTKYYWRVIPRNYGGVGGQTSAFFTFYTAEPPPDTCHLISPENLALNQPISIEFQWLPATRAKWYHLIISTTQDLQSGIFYSYNGIDTIAQSINGLENDTRYYWTVIPENYGGARSQYSIFSFKTVISPPPVPKIILPENNSQGEVAEGMLAWASSVNADNYILKITTDTLTWNRTGETITLTDTVYRRKFASNTKYYWRVAANSYIGGRSQWTQTMRFQTGPFDNFFRQDLSIPSKLDISQNYPNPFNQETNFILSLPQASDVRVEIYSTTGGLVGTVVSHPLAAGSFRFFWRPTNLSSGVYIYRLRVNNVLITKKLLLLK